MRRRACWRPTGWNWRSKSWSRVHSSVHARASADPRAKNHALSLWSWIPACAANERSKARIRRSELKRVPLRSTACRARCRACASPFRISARARRRSVRDRPGNAASRYSGFPIPVVPAPSRHSRARGSRSPGPMPVAIAFRMSMRRGQADAFVDRQRRILDEEIRRMQHEAAPGLDRSALHHLHVFMLRRPVICSLSDTTLSCTSSSGNLMLLAG